MQGNTEGNGGVARQRSAGLAGFARGLRWLCWLVIAGCAVALARLLPVSAWLQQITVVAEGAGPWGLVIFGLAYVVAALLFVPGAAITIAAGAVFGLGLGIVVVSFASTAAAALAFAIARYAARGAVTEWAKRYPWFVALDQALERGGWRIVALLRLSPVVPFNVLNYLLGLTAVRFGPYVLASWIFMLPGTVLYVGAGYASRLGLEAAAGQEAALSLGRWLLLVVGLAATLFVTVYAGRLARQAMAEQVQSLASPKPQQPATRTGASSTGLLVLASLAVLMVAVTSFAYLHAGGAH